MNFKIHYLFGHLDRFPENLGKRSEEQGKRCYQDIKVVKKGIKEDGTLTIAGILSDISHLPFKLESLTRDLLQRFNKTK